MAQYTGMKSAAKTVRKPADYCVRHEQKEGVWVVWQRAGDEVRGLALSEHELRSEAFAHLDELLDKASSPAAGGRSE